MLRSGIYCWVSSCDGAKQSQFLVYLMSLLQHRWRPPHPHPHCPSFADIKLEQKASCLYVGHFMNCQNVFFSFINISWGCDNWRLDSRYLEGGWGVNSGPPTLMLIHRLNCNWMQCTRLCQKKRKTSSAGSATLVDTSWARLTAKLIR